MRIATAFPPLVDDISGFLIQLGRVCLSQSCLHGSYDHRIVSSLLEQLDVDHERIHEKEINFSSKPIREEIASPPPSDEPIDVDVKKEKEEGELEEGELPEARPNNQASPQESPTPQSQTDVTAKNLDLCADLSANFSLAQIRKLIKILPESSVMGAEISRTFAELCNRAILHKKIY